MLTQKEKEFLKGLLYKNEEMAMNVLQKLDRVIESKVEDEDIRGAAAARRRRDEALKIMNINY